MTKDSSDWEARLSKKTTRKLFPCQGNSEAKSLSFLVDSRLPGARWNQTSFERSQGAVPTLAGRSLLFRLTAYIPCIPCIPCKQAKTRPTEGFRGRQPVRNPAGLEAGKLLDRLGTCNLLSQKALCWCRILWVFCKVFADFGESCVEYAKMQQCRTIHVQRRARWGQSLPIEASAMGSPLSSVPGMVDRGFPAQPRDPPAPVSNAGRYSTLRCRGKHGRRTRKDARSVRSGVAGILYFGCFDQSRICERIEGRDRRARQCRGRPAIGKVKPKEECRGAPGLAQKEEKIEGFPE